MYLPLFEGQVAAIFWSTVNFFTPNLFFITLCFILLVGSTFIQCFIFFLSQYFMNVNEQSSLKHLDAFQLFY